jgi:hypothetical protein
MTRSGDSVFTEGDNMYFETLNFIPKQNLIFTCETLKKEKENK